MFKQIKIALLMLGLSFLTACGFQFQNGQLIPAELQTLKLESSDAYSDISVAMRRQLLASNVNLVEQGDVAVLRINKASTNDVVISVFKQGREAEKMLKLHVEASVKLANQNSYPIEVTVNRTFFDNSRAALAKSAEKEMLLKDMNEQAARQIMSKMIALQQQVK